MRLSSLQNAMDEKLYQERAILRHEGRERLKRAKQTIARADALLDPRRQFNNWARSAEGREWRKAEFRKRKGLCAYCGQPMRESDAVIHHVKPLAVCGEAANTTSNYRLLHPNCNAKIGTKIVKLLF